MHSFSRLKQKDKDIFFEKPYDSNSRLNKTEIKLFTNIYIP